MIYEALGYLDKCFYLGLSCWNHCLLFWVHGNRFGSFEFAKMEFLVPRIVSVQFCVYHVATWFCLQNGHAAAPPFDSLCLISCVESRDSAFEMPRHLPLEMQFWLVFGILKSCLMWGSSETLLNGF